uniref:acyl carrier protein n=1 Tax=Saccharopolyspora galaxeae TaxID=2781241 RepID=UPI00190D1932|nr:acyl carrier protein [Saccharopolyspora sp. HNM0986]
MSGMEPVDLDHIQTQIRGVLTGLFGDEARDVAADSELRDTLGDRYDSLGALECITEVEKQFGIEVDFVADDIRYAFSTIDNMARFVRNRREDMAALGTIR